MKKILLSLSFVLIFSSCVFAEENQVRRKPRLFSAGCHVSRHKSGSS